MLTKLPLKGDISMKSFHNELTEYFYKAVLELRDTSECRNFFEDVCTVKELQDISQRLRVAQMLNEGHSYQEVSKETGASTATISRVNKCLVYGSGGYNTVMQRIEKSAEEAES